MELDEYDRHYGDTNPNKRLPNYMVLALGQDHTRGTTPGAPTPASAAMQRVLLGPRAKHQLGLLSLSR